MFFDIRVTNARTTQHPRCLQLLALYVASFSLARSIVLIEISWCMQSAFPTSEGDLFDWTATIEGPSETVSTTLHILD